MGPGPSSGFQSVRGSLLASILGAPAIVGGLRHVAERLVRKATLAHAEGRACRLKSTVVFGRWFAVLFPTPKHIGVCTR